MNKKLFSLLTVCLATVGYGTTAKAVTVSLHGSNTGIQNLNVTVNGTTISIVETWNSTGNGVLAFSGLEIGTAYTIEKTIINNSLSDWTSLANELLDRDNGPFSNDSLDPKPYPSFVPSGFTTSNNNDGLSFAQGFNIPRESSVFLTVIPDEITDERDFLDFVNGTLDKGQVDDFLTFGIVDTRLEDVNQPFLLVQRPNTRSVDPPFPPTGTPEPTLVLGFLAFSTVGMVLKRKLD